MAQGRISIESVKAVSAQSKNAFLWDTKITGFGLKVTPAGAKTYIYQYRMGGRGHPVRRYTIGPHGKFTPDMARKVAEHLATRVAIGVDPILERQEQQAAQEAERLRLQEEERQATELMFSMMVPRFLKSTRVTDKWSSSAHNIESAFRLHVTPALGDKPLPRIGANDLRPIFEALEGKPALHRSVHAMLSAFFKWAIAGGQIAESPLKGFEAPTPPAPRERVLDDDELRFLWIAASKAEYPFGPFYRLLLATGQRREEVAALDWRELDRSHRAWSLPGDRTKNGKPHLVHLNDLAMADLDELAKCAGRPEADRKWPRRGLVLTTTGKTPISGFSRAKGRLDQAMLKAAQDLAKEAGEDPAAVELKPWRLHDIRRTVATGFQKLGIRFEVTEAILNHVGVARAGVAKVYQLHDWAPEKRDALNAWARHLKALFEPPAKSNVVPIEVARA